MFLLFPLIYAASIKNGHESSGFAESKLVKRGGIPSQPQEVRPVVTERAPSPRPVMMSSVSRRVLFPTRPVPQPTEEVVELPVTTTTEPVQTHLPMTRRLSSLNSRDWLHPQEVFRFDVECNDLSREKCTKARFPCF